MADAGLPVRVVNSVVPAGVATIGQLRTWSDQQLLSLRSLGRISLGHVRGFFKLCGQIEQGRQTFRDIQEVFSIFLDDSEFGVVSARYGFKRQDLAASRNCATLQRIGDEQRKTRERIRQIQETALKKLQSRLALVCLRPFYERISTFLGERGGSATCKDLAPLQGDTILAGHNICGVLLLLSDLSPGELTFYHGFFSALRLGTVQATESQVMAFLDQEGRPLPLARILETLPPVPGLEQAEQRQRTVGCIMDHCPAVAATLDGRYFLYRNGTQGFLVEILRQMERPTHYRKVTEAFNERLKPLSRKGAGFILEMLNSNPQCTRVDRGIYDLKAD